MHVTVVQIINQGVVVGIYLYPHHHLINKFRLIGNETAQTVMVTQINAQRFCNIHSGLFGSVNKHIGAVRTVKVQRFEEYLYNNTGTRHHGKTDDIRHEQYRSRRYINVHATFCQHTRYQQQCVGNRQRYEYARYIYKR